MKKLAIVCLILVFIAGLGFGQDEWSGEPEQKLVYFGFGVGLMYVQPISSSSTFNIWNLRAGGHADVLFSLGMFEIGMEIGLYAMEIDYTYGYVLILEVPLNAIFRINFDPNRIFGVEIVGGGWLKAIIASGGIAEFGFNVGGRVVLSYFYIGGDYIITSDIFYPAWCIELGAKFSL